MSGLSLRHPSHLPVPGPVVRLGAMARRAWVGLEHVMEVWEEQRALETLDDRMLKDMGITRAQANYEAHRAPWTVRQLFDEEQQPEAEPPAPERRN